MASMLFVYITQLLLSTKADMVVRKLQHGWPQVAEILVEEKFSQTSQVF